jgi:hypothetical protein
MKKAKMIVENQELDLNLIRLKVNLIQNHHLQDLALGILVKIVMRDYKKGDLTMIY